MKNLIIVSNRLPFRIDKKAGRYEMKQSSGGLVSALLSIPSENTNITWIGIADIKKDIWSKVKDSILDSQCRLEPLFVDKKKYHRYYNEFSNTLIWPLYHYFPSYAEYDEAAFKAYQEINKEFADKIIELAQIGDTVWVHDYHLMLLPKYIKSMRPDLCVGFFLHVPFPSYEILKLIPELWRSEILNGLISSDVVGFHTAEYVSHFKRSLSYFSGIEANGECVQIDDHSALVNAYPISIDFEKFNNAYDSPSVIRGRNIIRQKNRNVKIIFSVDRLDYTKGVINRLQAYESLLQTHPELREKVTFVINVVPSRDQIAKYAERKRMIEENIGRINGLYGNMHWHPVIYQYRHLTFNQLMSFYSVADVALITPLRDGMNLVAKEFVASRKDKKGVLVLSEFAGAASELRQAILVNPHDILTMKNGIMQALSLSESEQRVRMNEMQDTLRKFDIHAWTKTFLNDLKKSKNMNYQSQPHVMTFNEKVELFDSYRKTKKRLLLLDYDGTLVPFHNKPEDAKPGSDLKDLLTQLNNHPENEVVIVSGRDAATLENWFSGTGVSYVAEHGALLKRPDKDEENFATDGSNWSGDVEKIFEGIIAAYPNAFIEKKQYSLALHYREVSKEKVDDLLSDVKRELLMIDTNSGFSIINGSMVLEVKSRDVDKGNIVTKIISESKYDFVLALGDDTTDEDMFSVLSNENNYFTVKVGIVPTKAKCNLINVNNVISFLDQLNKYKSPLNLTSDTYPFNSN